MARNVAFDHSIVGKTFGPSFFEYDWQKPALFALACGATGDELDLLLETRGPKVLPTFSAVVQTAGLTSVMEALQGNMLMRLHSTQKILMHRPIPSLGKLSTEASVRKIYDQGKAALVIFDAKTSDADGVLFETEMQVLYRAHGGFGGEKAPEPAPQELPQREPDAVLDMPTNTTQALLYRLGSGDLNPIHSDPAMSKRVGLPKPILHGLCTFSFAARAAVQSLCGGDVHRLKGIEGRFSKPVFPGETLRTSLWRVNEQEAVFVTSAKDRNEVVLDLGRVTIG